MLLRYIRKVLAGAQDLVFGQGTAVQTRGTTEVEIEKINATHIPYSGDVDTTDMVSVKEKMDEIIAFIGLP